MADQNIIKYISAKTGFGLKFVSKDEKISLLLARLTNLLDKRFVLKGGTALSRVYLNQKRFSEDIDFDFVYRKSKKEKIRIISNLVKKIGGFEIEGPRKMKEVIRYDCCYRNEFGEKDKIRLEFNLSLSKFLTSKIPEKRIITSHILPSEPANLFVYSLEDLMAMKIRCLLERTDGKDVFDLFFSFEINPNKKLLHKSLALLGLKKEILKKELEERLKMFEKKSSKIGNSANHYIPKNLRPNWLSIIRDLKIKLRDI